LCTAPDKFYLPIAEDRIGSGTILRQRDPRRNCEFTGAMPPQKCGRKEVPIKAKQNEVLRTQETIMLVDDEDYIRELVGAILAIEGYHVLEADCGPRALELSEEHDGPIHLLLTDVVMSPMSGGELVKRMTPLRPEMKVLYISGYADDALVQHGVDQAQVSFLAKPFTPKMLVGKIRNVLDAVLQA
jgi:response regulator RpfG family c-di-GMP phosphodiesterase